MDRIRQLAAIMFTEIENYSVLMQEDEIMAANIRINHRKIFNEAIQKFNGKNLQYYGDHTLSIFNSALDAVQCAIAMQIAFRNEYNIPVRMGIHLGDIAINKEDVIGNGVNITSRIESIAVPGSVFISEKIFDEIKNHTFIQIKSLGAFHFKNVSKPIKVYAVVKEGLKVPSKTELRGKHKKSLRILSRPWIIMFGLLMLCSVGFYYFRQNDSPQESSADGNIQKSIAVLPFKNFSTNPENQYFSDGIMEAILDHLTKIGELKVISRTSVMQYRNTQKTIPEIAGELGVSYLLEGSVARYDNTVVITAELIDVSKEQYVWSENYERELTDIFAVQSEVAQHIAQILKVKINPEVKERIEIYLTENTEAYNHYLKARFYLYGGELDHSLNLLNKSRLADPNFAPAYADMAFIWLLRGAWSGNLTAEEVRKKALPLLNKAIALEENYSDTHWYMALYKLWFQWDFEGAEREFNRAFQLNPSNARLMQSAVDLFLATGRYKEAMEYAELAIQADPMFSNSWLSKGLSLYYMNRFPEALETFNSALKLYSSPELMVTASRVFLYLEEYDQVIETLETFFKKYPDMKAPRALANLAIAYSQIGETQKSQELLAEIKERSEKSPVGSPSFFIAMIYSFNGEKEVALKWLDKAYKTREVEMYWLQVEPLFKSLYGDPEFNDLLKKVGLKKPAHNYSSPGGFSFSSN